MRNRILAAMPLLALAACGSEPAPRETAPAIEVRSAEQEGLHKLAHADLQIALKRAIQDSGYRCQRVEDAGFVGKHENLDMWTATCTGERDGGRKWAIFSGPDGSAQVRDCGDVAKAGLPACTISEASQKPAG